MARLNDNQRDLILADYHTGKYSQRKLANKYNVSLGTINNLTKEIDPKNEHLVNAQISILSAKSELPNEQLNAILNTAQELAFNKGLVFNVTQKALKKLNTIVDTVESPDDIKTIIEASDRASLTLGVNPRFAPKTDINLSNNQQNNDNKLEVVFK